MSSAMILGLTLSFIFGAVIGSFLNVLILRLPKAKSIGGRSRCVNCGHELNVFDLVPIASYIFLGRKCRYCQKPISKRYILIEIATGLLFAANFYFLMSGAASLNLLNHLALLRYDFICAFLVVIFAIDFEHSLILNRFLLPTTLILFGLNLLQDFYAKSGMQNSLAWHGLISGLAVFLFFGALYRFPPKGKYMGDGDMKF